MLAAKQHICCLRTDSYVSHQGVKMKPAYTMVEANNISAASAGRADESSIHKGSSKTTSLLLSNGQ